MVGTVTRWWWIRHAPVVEHGGKIYGQGDIACDISDTRSFEGLAKKLPIGAKWVTSHLSRTKDTAKAILQAGELDLITSSEIFEEPNFAEQSFGDWQDCTWDDLHAQASPEYKSFWNNPGYHAPPGGESFFDLMERTNSAIWRLNDEFPNRDIIAVTHGGTIRAAVALAIGAKPMMALGVAINNLTLTRLDYVSEGLYRGQGGVWRIEGINLPPI